MRYEIPTGLMTDQRRERLCQWARDNGLDPNSIPADAPLVIEGGTITTEVFVRGDDGKVVISGHCALRTPVSVPLRVPWTERHRTQAD